VATGKELIYPNKYLFIYWENLGWLIILSRTIYIRIICSTNVHRMGNSGEMALRGQLYDMTMMT
jgi:hypothetical protein